MWISVKDKLPADCQEILVYSTILEEKLDRKLEPYACLYCNGKFKAYHRSSQNFLNAIEITHWHPLPPPPKNVI